jgi:DNA repair protein RecN (Recombination protein N)
MANIQPTGYSENRKLRERTRCQTEANLMLKQLQIQNYAIIDEIDIVFSGKLNVITGETGAGKSILMGALALILGERADPSVLLIRDKKCFIEGIFSMEQQAAAKAFLKENDLDAEEDLVIRREIGSNGKSRAFVNDTPVNLDQLRRLSSQLVDLHQQFDNLSLAEAGFQRDVLDAMAGHVELLGQYRNAYRQWIQEKMALAILQQQKLQFAKEYDYNQFLFDELEQAALKAHELENLEAELKLFTNAEGIKTALSKVYADLQEGDKPFLQQLKASMNQLQAYSSYHSDLPVILQRLVSSQIELQDIAGDISRVIDQVRFDPERIEQINERLNMGYKLLKKHGFQYTQQLISLREELGNKLQGVLNIDEQLADREKKTGELLQLARTLATRLSENRRSVVKPLEKKVNQLLGQVGMPNARLKVELSIAELDPDGMDDVAFLFDANKSNRFEPIFKVASGGELSRLMLCIKSLVAQSIDLPTLIFDEIDTGISGEAAKQVALLLKNLSGSRQVICITHQPQIAGKADEHFLVYKMIRGEAIHANIKLLSREERIATIAEMLGGEKPTAAALENAREMMMN